MRRWVIAALIVVVLGVVIFFVVRGRVSGPTYQRSAQITDIAWGKDGSLYMLVHWVVAEHLPGRGPDIWNTIMSFSDDAVYRLDPNERVVRTLPMVEAKEVIARWPRSPFGEYANGWVGGRCKLQAVLTREGDDYEYHGTSFRDFQTGETSSIPVHFIPPHYIDDARLFARLSPDDRYMVYHDSKTKRLIVQWLTDGRKVIAPQSVFPVGRSGLPYPITEGLLDPIQKLLIDPVTFDTKVGWDFGNGSSDLHGPDGKSGAYTDRRTGTLYLYIPQHDIRLGGWGFPSENSVGILPDAWKSLAEYPKEYRIP